jgi:hypothetical protein
MGSIEIILKLPVYIRSGALTNELRVRIICELIGCQIRSSGQQRLMQKRRFVLKSALFILMIVSVVACFAGRLEISNDTGSYEFYFVYISPADSDSWGDDWLGSEETISPGYSRSFNLDNGSYDVMVEDEDGDTYTFWNVGVSGTVSMSVGLGNLGEQTWGSGTTTTTSSTGSAAITISNDLGSYTIWNVYGDPSDSAWGEDRLGSETLAPGESFTFYVPSGEYYDFKCVDEDDDTYTLWEVWVGDDGFYWSVDLSDID